MGELRLYVHASCRHYFNKLYYSVLLSPVSCLAVVLWEKGDEEGNSRLPGAGAGPPGETTGAGASLPERLPAGAEDRQRFHQEIAGKWERGTAIRIESMCVFILYGLCE